ncbi:hypothetical protein [Nonomuraea lactucae]|uniref:hypothetical protein n=1 Tax=Nonomuraea lactucae TaxID=2249762 RepID=UPI000DE1B397|nr:hypothetical protein [Nonomuraea lactucae]
MAAAAVSTPTAFVLRDEVQAGDVLLAWQSSDTGAMISMEFGEADGWVEKQQQTGFGWVGTKVYQKTAQADETDVYGLQQGLTAKGTIHILAISGANPAGVLIVVGGTDTCPAAVPSSSSGLEIRYQAGIPFTPGTVSWDSPPGYEQRSMQSGTSTTSCLAVRAYSSSAPLDEVALTPSALLADRLGITVLVASASGSGGGTPPTPPEFPATSPSRGTTRMRYTVHDLLTGVYVGEFTNLSGVTMDRRLGEPGTFQASLAVPNRRVARRIQEIIPADPTDLSVGPGRLVVHCWRSGILWGVYWLHTAVIERPEGAKGVGIQLQGSTLDGYLHSVNLEDDVSFAADQIANARDLILHMQATAASNIGLGLMAGTSGSVRALAAATSANTTYGRLLTDYARTDGGFEWVVNPTVIGGSIVRSWEWGAPKISNPSAVHVFQEGGDLTTWREERSALRRGTRFGVIGGTPEGDATETRVPARSALIETPHIAAGWPIIDKRIQHPGQSTTVGVLDAYARYWADRAAGSTRVFSASLVLGKNPSLDPNGLGDWARFVLSNPWHAITADGAAGLNVSQRIIGWALSPADRGSRGKDKVQLITEQEVPE